MILISARVVICALIATMVAPALAQSEIDLSGLWKQDNNRCQPKRNNEVTLHIEQHSSELTIETTISRGSASSRHAIQHYTTDGIVSVSTGADGDEFHTSVMQKDESLVFTIEEHEDGRILRSHERWSLIDDGETLEKIRERSDGEKQLLFFRRQR